MDTNYNNDFHKERLGYSESPRFQLPLIEDDKVIELNTKLNDLKYYYEYVSMC